MKSVLALILAVVSFAKSFGQEKPLPLDTYMAAINAESSPSAKCEIALKAQHSLFMYRQIKESMVMASRGLEIAQENNLRQYEVPFLMDIGRIYEVDKDYTRAIDYGTMALKKLDDSTEHFRGKIYNYLGRHYQRNQQLDSMLHYYTKAEAWNKEHDPYRNWILYEQWHTLYVQQGDLSAAKQLLEKAYAITKPVGHRMDHGMLLYRLRMLASRSGDMEMLAKYGKEYYELTGKTGATAHGFDLGPDLTKREKIKKYEALFAANHAIAFDLANDYYYPNIINLCISTDQPEKALHYLNKIDTTGDNTLQRSDYEALSVKIYQSQNNFEEAFAHLERKIALDKININAERIKEIDELHIKYESEKKENEIALLQAQDEIKSIELAEAAQKKKVLGIGLGSALVFLALVAYLYWQNRKRKKLLEEKNAIIQKSLEEKDILLREIHHRVKNNLQVVSSILNLQSNYISDDIALAAINEGKNRVSSMALIHQNLYQDSNVTSINARSYFEDLISSLYDSYEVNEGEIQLELHVDDMLIDVDTMVPLGLIVNELVSNALKHAFTDNTDEKKLSVRLSNKHKHIELKVIDNGKGMTLHDFTSSNSFGNKLIQAFKAKLKADLQVDGSHGTEITFIISNYKIAA